MLRPSSRRYLIPVFVICFILSACSTTPSTASPAPQASPTAGQATAATAPAVTMSGSTGSGTLDPCKLITTGEVTNLLGSAPTPTTGVHANTGFHYCYFQTNNGILEVAALGTANAAAQFASAVTSFQSAPGYQKINAQGATIAFSGGPATNGNGTQGLVAAILKGGSLATVKLDSKSYTYNVNQASTLLETITGRLP
jgi:hypothetical protein